MSGSEIVRNDLSAVVVAIPDLYPKNKAFPHETFGELQAGILKNFEDALQVRGRRGDARLKERFKVFCFKYDLKPWS